MTSGTTSASLATPPYNAGELHLLSLKALTMLLRPLPESGVS